MEVANFFFYGELTKFEKNCITSFVDNGFKVKLWSYDNIELNGVETCDANTVLEKNLMSKIKQSHAQLDTVKCNFAAFSDQFRFTLISKYGGWWFDTDCYCLKNQNEYKKLRDGKELVSFYQEGESIACGAFYIDVNSKYRQLLINEFNVLLNDYQDRIASWGTFGPAFLGNFINKHNLKSGIYDISLAYAIHWNEFDLYINPNRFDEAKSRIKDSYLTHIWNSFLQINNVDKNSPPVGSLLEFLYQKYT